MTSDGEVTYETKTVRAVRGMESIKKWEADGWEFVSQSPGKVQAEITFRRPQPKSRRLLWMIGGPCRWSCWRSSSPLGSSARRTLLQQNPRIPRGKSQQHQACNSPLKPRIGHRPSRRTPMASCLRRRTAPSLRPPSHRPTTAHPPSQRSLRRTVVKRSGFAATSARWHRTGPRRPDTTSSSTRATTTTSPADDVSSSTKHSSNQAPQSARRSTKLPTLARCRRSQTFASSGADPHRLFVPGRLPGGVSGHLRCRRRLPTGSRGDPGPLAPNTLHRTHFRRNRTTTSRTPRHPHRGLHRRRHRPRPRTTEPATPRRRHRRVPEPFQKRTGNVAAGYTYDAVRFSEA